MKTTTYIDLYQAIREMRSISTGGGTFSIKFRKWNRSTQKGGDLVYIEHARVRRKTSDEVIDHSSEKLFLTDTDTGKPLNCWECLVVEFNGQRTILA